MKLTGAQVILFIIGAVIISGLVFFTEVAVQQAHRMAANDPQIEIAEDTAGRLEQSGAILDQIPTNRIDIKSSLKEFVIIYDTEGNAIAGNGYLGDKLLSVPKGVFDAAKAGEARTTLEPEMGVRVASVIVPFVGREANGFVLSGRNLREVENREKDLSAMALLTWAAAIIALILGLFSMIYFSHTR